MKPLSYLRLGVIVTLPLPNQIADGQTADAGPVMANMNYIANQINANVTPTSTYIGPGGVGGTANALTLTPAPAITAYTDGLTYTFLPTNANTSAVTVAISGLAPVPIVDSMGVAGALSGGEFSTLFPVTIIYIASLAAFKMLTPPASFSGTFTPAILFGAGAVGVTYGTRSGFFTKFGSFLHFALTLALTNKGSSVGGVQLTGLPYPINTSSPQQAVFAVQMSAVTFTAGYVIATPQNPTTLQLLNCTTAGALTNIQDTNCANTSAFNLSGFFMV